MHRHLWFAFSFACAAALMLVNCSGGDGPTQPTKNPPDITLFTATPSDIVPGDSVTLAYTVSNATQTKLYPGGQVLANATSGSIKVGPALPTLYAIVATNTDGKDSAAVTVTMSAVAPSITLFQPAFDTILVGDSSQIAWEALRADSIVVNSGVGKLSSATSGSRYVKPAASTLYQAVAFNQYGTDTAAARVRVEIPATIDAPEGILYKSAMGSSTSTPALKFTVRDAQSLLLTKPWIHFSRVMGDGQLSADSLQTGASGIAQPTYVFSGDLGYAVVRAKVTGVDSVDVSIRADAFVPEGLYPQGQYVLVGDQFSTVKALNGNPAAIDPDPRPSFLINYADYESSLGAVFMIQDDNDNNVAENGEPVYGIILNTVYAKKTKDNIGIGSTIAEVQAIYGAASGIYDPTEPPGYHYDYPTKGLTFWTDISPQRVVFEIHIKDPLTPGLVEGGRESGGQQAVRYSTLKSGQEKAR